MPARRPPWTSYGVCVYTGGMAKTRRVDLRLEDDEDQLIRQAAEMAGMTMSGFMLASAREKAEGILLERAVHLLDAAAWDRFVESFLEGYFERNPTFAQWAGRHEHDGRLTDWSPEGIEERAAWLRQLSS